MVLHLLKVIIFHGCFSRFLNCANGTKSHKACHLMIVVWFADAQLMINIFRGAFRALSNIQDGAFCENS